MASGYFVNVVPKNPNEDIVARRRKDDGGREPKSRSRVRDHWYVRTLFNNLSPLLLLAMLGLGALGGAIYVGLTVFSDEVSVADAGTDADQGDGFVPLKPRPAGDFRLGEDLSYGEALHAAKFGRPMYVGDSGRPVVSVNLGGDEVVRELTGLEMSLPSGDPQLVDRVQGVWFSPGPVGLGVWWFGPVVEEYSPPVSVPRDHWVDSQESMLFGAMRDLHDLLAEFTPSAEYGTTSWSLRVVSGARRLRDQHASGLYADWDSAASVYRCTDDAQEAAAGLASLPCPSGLYLSVLSHVWQRYGNVVDHLESAAMPFHPDYHPVWGLRGLARAEYVHWHLSGAVSDLVRYFKALHDLALVGTSEDLPMMGLVLLIANGNLELPAGDYSPGHPLEISDGGEGGG